MSKFFNAKSKKGFSLAYALVVCLFLILITGGITTVAIMQHNETGADLNTRQAYITAKGGLSSMETAFRTGLIPDGQLPTDLGWDEAYYILYQTTEDGPVFCTNAMKMEDVELFFKDHPDYIIVGGEGTYYKVSKDLRTTSTGNEDRFTLTALNTTGKYNANVTENKGDLSIDIAISKTVVYAGDRKGSTANPPSVASTFIMCGQQVSLNEISTASGSDVHSKLLNEYHQASSGGSGSGAVATDIMYTSSNDADFDHSRTYFPVVYDRTYKDTSGYYHRYATYNNGIYFLGSSSNEEVNTAAYRDPNRNAGATSYISNNPDFDISFECAYICIRNNLVVSSKTIVKYYGDGNTVMVTRGSSTDKGVIVRLVNRIKIIRVNSGGAEEEFTKSEGYYAIKSGDSMAYSDNWVKLTDMDAVNNYLTKGDNSIDLYETINSLYEDGGEIHTGSWEENNEKGLNNCIRITNTSGKFVVSTDQQTGYSGEDVGTYFANYHQDRSKMNIYLSPRYAPEASGNYHLFAGRSMNFQWIGSEDFNVIDGVNVNFCSPNIVLTIGCEGSMTGCPQYNGTATHNKIVRGGTRGTGKFRLYGYEGSGDYKLTVMSDFVVQYGSNSYTIKAGEYSGSQFVNGLDLFSDEAKAIFENTTPSSGGSGGSGGGTSETTEETINVDEELEAPVTGTTKTIADGTTSLSIDADYLNGVSVLVIPDDMEHLYLKNLKKCKKEGSTSVDCNKMSITGRLEIKRGSESAPSEIIFLKGTYDFPCVGTENTDGFDLIDKDKLASRVTDPNTDYKQLSSGGSTGMKIIDGEYS